MRKLLYSLFFVILAASVLSCSKKDDFSVTFERVGIYFKWGGEPSTCRYTAHRVQSIVLAAVSDGWKCDLDTEKQTVTMTPPKDPGSETERELLREGTASFKVTSNSGGTATYVISMTVVDDKNIIDLTPDGKGTANCYIVTQPEALYYFDLTDGAGNSLKDVKDLGIVWKSGIGLIKDVNLEQNGRGSFFIGYRKDDDGNAVKDSEGHYQTPYGNALIEAVNSEGDTVWSWHIWVIDPSEDPRENCIVLTSGQTFMNKNLGSYFNSEGSEKTNEILDSYGLYYQWGRKDPFLRPMHYMCQEGYDEYVYDEEGSVTYPSKSETSDSVGNVEYATENPYEFITNPNIKETEVQGDWMYFHDDNLWKDLEKTKYDPCPAGWRVPKSGDFDAFTLPDSEDQKDLKDARKQFGWHFSDGTNTFFFLAGGLHSYYDGIVRNMNSKDVYPYTPEPWEGYYWTSGLENADGSALFFDLTTTRTVNKFVKRCPVKRGNACQIRCVKEE